MEKSEQHWEGTIVEHAEKLWIIKTRKGYFEATTRCDYLTYEDAFAAYKAEAERTQDCPF
jgi:uncharacterized protein involved in tolerance to divalent cations